MKRLIKNEAGKEDIDLILDLAFLYDKIANFDLAENMNRKEFAEWLGIPYRTMQDWERGVSEVPDYVLNLIAYKVKNEKEKGNI